MWQMARVEEPKNLKGYPTIYRILNIMKMHMLIIFLANLGESSILRGKKKLCAQQPVFSQRPLAYIIWIKKKKKANYFISKKGFLLAPGKGH